MGTISNNVLNITANTTAVIPAGYSILQIVVENTTGNAVLGGLKIGTTNGGVEVAVAVAISASSLFAIPDSTLLKSVFSMSSDTTLYLQAITAWNSANINIRLVLRKIN